MPIAATQSPVTPANLPGTANAAQVGANGAANNTDMMALFRQSTDLTLQLQMAMIAHNMAVGPAMKAAEASGDAKK